MKDEALPLRELQDSVVAQLAAGAARSRQHADRDEVDTCIQGRAAGWSWERLGRALGVPSETLRRRHARLVAARLAHTDTPTTRR